MPQVRVKKENKFTQIENDFIQNPGLSLKAKGLLIYMLSMPDDWDYSISSLSVKCKEGKSSIRSTIAELMEYGYITRTRARTSQGKLDGYEYTVYERPQPSCDFPTTENPSSENPSSENPSSENPSSENPSSENRTEQILYRSNTVKTNIPPLPPTGGRGRKRKSIPTQEPERFEKFWKAYPRDEERAKAVAEWDKLLQDKELLAAHNGDASALLDEISVGLGRHLACEEWQRNVGIPHAFRWLRNRRWTEKQKVPLSRTDAPADGGWAQDPEVY